MKGEVIHLACREQIDLDLELTSYVSGNMTKQEKLAFEARLVNDKQLQQKLADEIEFKNQLNGSQENTPKFNLEFKDLENKLDSKSAHQYSIIAASLFIMISLSYFFVPNTGTDTASNSEVNEFETLTSEQSGTLNTVNSYSLVLRQEISLVGQSQLLKELQLIQVSTAKIEGLSKQRLTVRSEKPMTRAQLEMIKRHQMVLFFESNDGVSEN